MEFKSKESYQKVLDAQLRGRITTSKKLKETIRKCGII